MITLDDLTVGSALALVVGAILKRSLKAKPQVLRDAIPVFNFAIQFLGRLVLEVTPAQAGVFGSLKSFASGPLLDLAVQSAFVTLLSSGTQSTSKNVAKAFGVNTVLGIKARLIAILGGVPPAPPVPPAEVRVGS